MNKEKLNQLTLDIEFLLISVIQGVALASLATSAMIPLTTLQFQYWPYIFTAFLFILVFWSGAIIHAVSFIAWPPDLIHSFIYFLASLIEVMAINNINNPLNWFVFLLIFQIVAGILYLYDLSMIRKSEKNFKTPDLQKLYKHILKEQIMELKIFIPSSLVFNIISILTIVYIDPSYNLLLIILQGIFGLIFLLNSLNSFKTRSKLISNK